MQSFPKEISAEDQSYRDIVKQLPCCICQRQGETIVPHHVYAGGVAMKCSDYDTVPLCCEHHGEIHGKIPREYEGLRKEWFFIKYGYASKEVIALTRKAVWKIFNYNPTGIKI